MKQTKKEQIALLFSFLSITDVGHERFINVFCVVYKVGGLDVETNRDRDRERP